MTFSSSLRCVWPGRWSQRLWLGLVLSLAIGSATAVEPAMATSPTSEMGNPASSIAARPSDRRLRSEGFAAALPRKIEFELWVRSPIVADLIAEFYATSLAHPRTGMKVQTVPYVAARLVVDRLDRTPPSFLYPDGTTPQDIDRLERCLAAPLRRGAASLPCNRPGSGCWLDLGAQSAQPGRHLFPLQLGLFLESAGYSVELNGRELGTLLKSLETGRMRERRMGRIIQASVPPKPEPEFPWTLEDIRLFDCEPVAE